MEMFSATASYKKARNKQPTNYTYLKMQLKLHKHLRKEVAQKAQTLPLSWELEAQIQCVVSLSHISLLIYLI